MSGRRVCEARQTRVEGEKLREMYTSEDWLNNVTR